MIKFSQDFNKKHLLKNISKGDVLFWKDYQGKYKIKDAYFIILTGFLSDGSCYAVRGTTNVALHTDKAFRRIQTSDILIIKMGETKIFPKTTVLNFVYLNKFSVDDIAKLLGAGIINSGRLSPEIIKKINDTVSSARTIAPIHKKIILSY